MKYLLIVLFLNIQGDVIIETKEHFSYTIRELVQLKSGDESCWADIEEFFYFQNEYPDLTDEQLIRMIRTQLYYI